MKFRSIVTAACIAAAGLVSTAGDATVITTTFSGTVGGSDGANYFGLGTTIGQALATVTYVFDDQAPGAQYITYNLGTYIAYTLQGFGSATLTINGRSISTTINAQGAMSKAVYTNGRIDYYMQVSGTQNMGVNQSNSFTGHGIYNVENYTNASLTDQFSLLYPQYRNPGGTPFQQSTYNTTNAIYSQNINVSFLDGFDYGVNVTIAASAVPEPASWAMMIGGMGIAGGMMRRRASGLARRLA